MTDFGLSRMLNFRCIIFKGIRYDKMELNNAIDHLANYIDSNIRSDSPFILMTAYNHIKSVIAYHAILRSGKIAAVLDPEWKSMEVAEVIDDIDPAAILFINNSTTGFNYEEEVIFRSSKKSFIIYSELSGVCTLAYTNAEDGYSKGAMLTEKNLMTEVDAIIKANHLDEHSVSYSLLPFSHLYGLVLGVLVSTHSGGVSVITELNLMKIQDTLDEVMKYKVTHLYSVPSVYYIISKSEGVGYLLRNVKMCVSGGNKLTSFIFENFYAKTNHKIQEGYGLTETSPACTFNFSDDEPNIESVGRPLADSDIRIFDEDQKECAPGLVGEICIKGDLVFKGYFNREETTENAMRNGWFHTGDSGKIDKDGLIYFCGLKKNMINVAGNKVYPKKLERMMMVNKNAVDVSIYSEESVLQGQIICSRMRLNDNSIKAQEEYKKWCQENINNITLPKRWLFE